MPGTSYSALTTEQGEFQLRDLRAGTVTLRVSHLAYGERTLSVDLTGDAPTYVRLALSRSAILLEAIEVDDLQDVAVMQPRCHARFVDEHQRRALVRDQLGAQQLDHERSLEAVQALAALRGATVLRRSAEAFMLIRMVI